MFGSRGQEGEQEHRGGPIAVVPKGIVANGPSHSVGVKIGLTSERNLVERTLGIPAKM